MAMLVMTSLGIGRPYDSKERISKIPLASEQDPSLALRMTSVGNAHERSKTSAGKRPRHCRRTLAPMYGIRDVPVRPSPVLLRGSRSVLADVAALRRVANRVYACLSALLVATGRRRVAIEMRGQRRSTPGAPTGWCLLCRLATRLPTV